MNATTKFIETAWEPFVYFCSGEWILKESGSNGGAVILLRSLFVAIVLTCLALALRNGIDPKLTEPASWSAFRIQLVEIAPWFSIATGAVYAALYARFSAQWSYLADVYNQIKQGELELAYTNKDCLLGLKIIAEWKAGYIEDAHTLHLHAKDSVAAVVHHWGKDPIVSEAFIQATSGGKVRWDTIQLGASKAYEKATFKYK